MVYTPSILYSMSVLHREANKVGPWFNLKKATPVTRITLRITGGPVPVDSWQWTSSVCPCVTRWIRDWPDGGWRYILCRWMSSREAGEIPRMSTISSLSRENERADTGRNGRSESASRDQILRCKRGLFFFFFPVQLTTSRIGNHN